MPKPDLTPELTHLEFNIIQTLKAGLQQYRPDLSGPESYSDWQGCVRALLVMYDVSRRPLPQPLPSPCPDCEGLGYFIKFEEGIQVKTSCRKCNTTGKTYY